MEVFLVYTWLKLDGLKTFIGVLAGLCAILAIASAIAMEEVRQNRELHRRNRNRFVGSLLVLATISFGIPSGRETAYMVATHYAVQVSQSPEAGKVVSLLRKKANEFLDAELKAK